MAGSVSILAVIVAFLEVTPAQECSGMHAGHEILKLKKRERVSY